MTPATQSLCVARLPSPSKAGVKQRRTQWSALLSFVKVQLSERAFTLDTVRLTPRH